jgi:signal recognition particle GTPase
VRDLSEAAMDEAELEGCDVSFLDLAGRTVPDRWLLIEVADCCETERSRGAATADSESISSCQTASWS